MIRETCKEEGRIRLAMGEYKNVEPGVWGLRGESLIERISKCTPAVLFSRK